MAQIYVYARVRDFSAVENTLGGMFSPIQIGYIMIIIDESA